MGKWILILWKRKQSLFPWKLAFICLGYLKSGTSMLMVFNGSKQYYKCGHSYSPKYKWTYFYIWAITQVFYSCSSTRSKTLAGGIPICVTFSSDYLCLTSKSGIKSIWLLSQELNIIIITQHLLNSCYVLSALHAFSQFIFLNTLWN